MSCLIVYDGERGDMERIQIPIQTNGLIGIEVEFLLRPLFFPQGVGEKSTPEVLSACTIEYRGL